MIFTTPHPGTWQEFMSKPENKKIPIHEATQKYRHQLLLFENQYLTFIQQQQQLQSQSSSGGGPARFIPRPLILEYTIVSPNTTISIPLGGSNFTEYDFSVDWGDGVVVEELIGNNSNLNAQMVHTYAEPGVYEVTILGKFPYLYLYGGTNKNLLTDIKQWGTTKWESMNESFRGCTGLTNITATDAPDMTRFKTQPLGDSGSVNIGPKADLFYTFRECSNLTNINFMSNWDMSQVRVVAALFRVCSSLTGWSALQNWDTSNIISMFALFQDTPITSNDLNYVSSWNVSSASSFRQLFIRCNGITNVNDLANWNMSSATNLGLMFQSCNSLINLDGLSNWDVSNVTTMERMFQGFSINSPLTDITPLANWNTGNVTNMYAMFSEVPLDSSINVLNNWDVSSVTTMEFMFDGGGNNPSNNITATSVNLNNWDVSSVTNMGNIFDDQFFITNLGIDQWNIKNVTNFSNAPCQNTTLTTESYDAILIGWASRIPLAYNGTLVFGGSKYTPGGAAEAARAALIADVGAISDGGPAS